MFPRCLKCHKAVEFRLIQQAPDIQKDSSFRVVLFGLPTTDEILEEKIEKVTTEVTSPATAMDGARDHLGTTASASNARDKTFDGLPQTTLSVPNPLPGDGLQMARTKHASAPKFKPGELVPENGVYGVDHDSHGLFHQATLAKNALFPKCRSCGSEVRFRLLRASKLGLTVAPLSTSVFEDLDGPVPPATKVG